MLSSVSSDPINREIHEPSLVHQTEFRVAELSNLDCFCPLEIRTDFSKVFSVNIKRFVLFPDSFPVFHDRAVFQTIVLSGIIRTHIRKMQGCVFVVTHSDQQDEAVQFVQLSDG